MWYYSNRASDFTNHKNTDVGKMLCTDQGRSLDFFPGIYPASLPGLPFLLEVC